MSEKIVIKSFLALIFSVCLLASFSCSRPLGVEVFRLQSPDGRVDAVLLETDGGATTSLGYYLYLVPNGKKVTHSDYAVFIADRLIDRRIYWQQQKLLHIEYSDARIINFKNYWYCRELDNFKYKVKIKEVQISNLKKDMT